PGRGARGLLQGARHRSAQGRGQRGEEGRKEGRREEGREEREEGGLRALSQCEPEATPATPVAGVAVSGLAASRRARRSRKRAIRAALTPKSLLPTRELEAMRTRAPHAASASTVATKSS